MNGIPKTSPRTCCTYRRDSLVTTTAAGQRLDQYLHSQLTKYSRAFLQKLIADQRIQVNGRPAKASYRVRAGDAVRVEIPPPQPMEVQPEAIPLDVLFEDDDLIVINKPAGLVVHPAAGNRAHTLVNALLHHCRGKLAGIGGVERPGIVHRLDKGTSGCIVVAKTDLAHRSLVQQFKARGVKKIYRAVCWGRFSCGLHEVRNTASRPPQSQPTGRIETLIGRSPHDRKKMSARVTRGRVALTEYRVLQQGADWALVELTLHTGRTHQIRVHLAHIGHPVVGDPVYGKGRKSSVISHQLSVARPLLHAYKLGFTDPRTGAQLEFEAPLPAEMTLHARDH